MHISLFFFCLFFLKTFFLGVGGGWGGGGGWAWILSKSINYHIKQPKTVAVFAVKTVKTKIIHNYVPEEAIVHNYMPKRLWSLGFDKYSNRNLRGKFSVYLERKYLSWDLYLTLSIIPCFCGHTNILIKAPLPYVAVVTVGIFRWLLAANEIS